mgnify:CR=1 FL=1
MLLSELRKTGKRRKYIGRGGGKGGTSGRGDRRAHV